MLIHTISNYVDQRYSFLKLVEGEVLWAYADSKGIPTIGIGLNLRTHGELILKALGFDLGGALLQGAALAAERQYASDLMDIIDNFPFPATADPFHSPNNAVMQALNSILQARAQNSALLAYDPANFASYDAYAAYQLGLTSSFQLGSSTVSAELLRLVLDGGYTVPGADGTPVSYNGGYEKLLDSWLTATGLATTQSGLMDHTSNERIALLSLAFNSKTYGNDQPNTPWNDIGLPTLLGPKLTNALRNDDRAEVWYEIRYDSGTDARRFLEADTFGLYNSGPLGEEDYKSAYRMLTRHRGTIFGTDGILGGGDDYEQEYQTNLSTAQSWGASLGIAVKDLNGSLAPAAEYLLAQYEVTGVPISWENIYVGEDLTTVYYRGTASDLITGSQSNDLLLAESGTDVLIGNGGSNVLHGGTGLDLYDLSGDTGDYVIDTDGQGALVTGLENAETFYTVGRRDLPPDGTDLPALGPAPTAPLPTTGPAPTAIPSPSPRAALPPPSRTTIKAISASTSSI
jgi:hypothetical protein